MGFSEFLRVYHLKIKLAPTLIPTLITMGEVSEKEGAMMTTARGSHWWQG
jgi:hypothetical protein